MFSAGGFLVSLPPLFFVWFTMWVALFLLYVGKKLYLCSREDRGGHSTFCGLYRRGAPHGGGDGAQLRGRPARPAGLPAAAGGDGARRLVGA